MLHNQVAEYIDRGKLLSLNDKVLVALSGGADSVALLRLLLQLGYCCEAAHCNFHLRGEESCRDEEFVKMLCRTCDVPLHIVHFETKEYAQEHHLSIEMAARVLRYSWFEQLRKEGSFDVIAIAHHRDDSVETFLLNLIRGTGINGLCGIRARNGFIVRPLLEVGRDDILSYLGSLGQDFVTDSTNMQDEYMRNKIRLNILPMMESINPSVKESIAATASRLEEAAHIYNKVMDEGRQRVLDEQGISIERLLDESAPKSLLFELISPLGFNASQTDEIFRSLDGQPGKQFFSAGWRILKDRTYLLLQRLDEVSKTDDLPKELPDKGELIYYKEKSIYVTKEVYTPDFRIPKERNVACLDTRKLTFPLTIRHWKAGDSFIPFGMKGKKLVSDYLTDRKFSRKAKEETYVVCSGEKIAWLVGERSDDRFRVDDKTEEVVILSVDSAY